MEKIAKNVPTDPEKWARAKAQAKAKFDVYPSAYANGWAAKKYKEMGGGWKKEASLRYRELSIMEKIAIAGGMAQAVSGRASAAPRVDPGRSSPTVAAATTALPAAAGGAAQAAKGAKSMGQKLMQRGRIAGRQLSRSASSAATKFKGMSRGKQLGTLGAVAGGALLAKKLLSRPKPQPQQQGSTTVIKTASVVTDAFLTKIAKDKKARKPSSAAASHAKGVAGSAGHTIGSSILGRLTHGDPEFGALTGAKLLAVPLAAGAATAAKTPTKSLKQIAQMRKDYVPGVGTYNQLKRLGAGIRGDEVKKARAERDAEHAEAALEKMKKKASGNLESAAAAAHLIPGVHVVGVPAAAAGMLASMATKTKSLKEIGRKDSDKANTTKGRLSQAANLIPGVAPYRLGKRYGAVMHGPEMQETRKELSRKHYEETIAKAQKGKKKS